MTTHRPSRSTPAATYVKKSRACPNCGAAVRSRERFCAQCGTRLALTCPSCGVENALDSRFCVSCGTALAGGQADTEPTGEERRIVTVLFADLVGYTPVAERMDPEDVRALQSLYFARMSAEVQRYGGTPEKYAGDAVLALFGAPVAHEDDAERAIRCGLAMQAALAPLAAEAATRWGMELRLRVGINTGHVVSGSWDVGGRTDQAVSGDAINVAARLQAAAEPGEVLVGEETMQLAQRAIEFGEGRALTLKGKSRPVVALPVLAARSHPLEYWDTRLQQSRLVGREIDLATLRGYLEQTREGRGRMVVISGEPGIGKSRLLYELRHSDQRGDVRWLAAHCPSYGSAVAYLPIIELLKGAWGIADGDDEAHRVERSEAATADWDQMAREHLPYLLQMLGLDAADPRISATDPLLRRAHVLDGLRALLRFASRHQPLALQIEDVHWIDEASAEALSVLADTAPSLPVLLVVTTRPGYAPVLSDGATYSRMVLDPLSGAASAVLAAELLNDEALSDPVRELIIGKAEGNPFYIEEVVRALRESGLLVKGEHGHTLARPIDQILIPDTIHEIILGRIDRLDHDARMVIQLASVIGRVFTLDLLRRVGGVELKLEASLAAMKTAELVYEKQYFPELTYEFRHALTHDVAYSTLTKERQRTLHRRVAEAIEALYPDKLADHCEVLAMHYVEGAVWPKALEYLVKSGEKAAAAYANQQALDFYAQALQVGERLGDAGVATARRAAWNRAFVNYTIGDWTAAAADMERVRVLTRAQEAGPGDRALEARALAYRGMFEWLEHSFEQAEQTLQEALALAREVEDDDAAFVAAVGYEWLLLVLNRHAEARAFHPEPERLAARSSEALALGLWGKLHPIVESWRGNYTSSLARTREWYALVAGKEAELGDAVLDAEWTAALALAGAGVYEEAIEKLEHVIARCEQIGEVYIHSRSLNLLGWIYGELQDIPVALTLNEQGLAMGRTMSDTEVIANPLLNLADLNIALGRLDEAEAYLREVEAVARHPTPEEQWMLWRYAQHHFHTYGEWWLIRGDPDRALAYANDCLQLAEESESRRNIVKGRRLSGQALAARGDVAQAEEELAVALRTAQEIGNPPQLWKTWVALGNLCRGQSRAADASRAYRSGLDVLEQVAASLKREALRTTLLHSSEAARIRSSLTQTEDVGQGEA